VNCFSCGIGIKTFSFFLFFYYHIRSHCICIEIDPFVALNLSTYTCECCTKKLAPPPNFEVPESEMFILMNEDGLAEEQEGSHVLPSSVNVKTYIEDDLLSTPSILYNICGTKQ
jgi:hypothetical protein